MAVFVLQLKHRGGGHKGASMAALEGRNQADRSTSELVVESACEKANRWCKGGVVLSRSNAGGGLQIEL